MAEALNLQQQSSKSQAKPMRRDEATTKALISACYAGDLERVVALLGDGADPSAGAMLSVMLRPASLCAGRLCHMRAPYSLLSNRVCSSGPSLQ